MDAFALYKTELQAALDFSNLEVHTFYTNKMPLRYFFGDEEKTEKIPIGKVLQQYEQNCYWIIYSDAGAMTRAFDQKWYQAWETIIQALWEKKVRFIWLNPVPAERWPGTLAAKLRQEAKVPMFTLEAEDCGRAIDYLLGKSSGDGSV